MCSLHWLSKRLLSALVSCCYLTGALMHCSLMHLYLSFSGSGKASSIPGIRISHKLQSRSWLGLQSQRLGGEEVTPKLSHRLCVGLSSPETSGQKTPCPLWLLPGCHPQFLASTSFPNMRACVISFSNTVCKQDGTYCHFSVLRDMGLSHRFNILLVRNKL